MIDRTMVLRSGLSRVFYLVGTACKSLFFLQVFKQASSS